MLGRKEERENEREAWPRGCFRASRPAALGLIHAKSTSFNLPLDLSMVLHYYKVENSIVA